MNPLFNYQFVVNFLPTFSVGIIVTNVVSGLVLSKNEAKVIGFFVTVYFSM